jgi:NAD(P)-dependent dehydrogenase (short-subunit alcohol dehydrogenase family)
MTRALVSGVRSRALVLGARGGIGSAVCDALRELSVLDTVDIAAVADAVAPPAATAPPADVASTGRDFTIDLTDDAARDLWLKDYLADVGSPDYVVWCAGWYPRRDIREYSTSELRHVVDVNLIAMIALLPALVSAALDNTKSMRLVVVGSQAAVTGGLDVPYAAAKAGLVAAVKSIAREYARRGIIANVVSPGPVETPMAAVMGDERRSFYENAIPLGRYTQPQEVADVIAWLLTKAPVAINGSVVDVDGGLVRR